jgi:hypothetical protein
LRRSRNFGKQLSILLKLAPVLLQAQATGVHYTLIGGNMRKSNTLFVTLAALSVIVIFSIPALSQGRVTGTITGVVTNPTGDVIQGAKVTASNKATGLKQETVTNSDGFYRLDLLPVGSYSVSTEFSGFKQSVNDAVNLSVNDVLRVDFKMEFQRRRRSSTQRLRR